MNLVPTQSYRLSVRTESALTTTTNGEVLGPLKSASTLVFIIRADRIYDNGDTGTSITVERYDAPFNLAVSSSAVGQTFGARLSPRGRITELGSTDALRAHVERSLPKPVESESGDNTPLLRSVSDETLAYTFDRVLNVWPEGPVARGDSWNREPIFNPSIDAYEFTEFRLTAVDSTGARVDFESKFRADDDAQSPTIGKATGELQLSRTEGILRSLRVETDVTVDASATMKMNTKNTVYVTFVPL